MAEVVRIRTERSTQTVSRNRETTVANRTSELLRVSSILSSRFDVSVLFDLVHALQEAGITRGGRVTARHSAPGHLSQLIVEVETSSSIEVVETSAETDRPNPDDGPGGQ